MVIFWAHRVSTQIDHRVSLVTREARNWLGGNRTNAILFCDAVSLRYVARIPRARERSALWTGCYKLITCSIDRYLTKVNKQTATSCQSRPQDTYTQHRTSMSVSFSWPQATAYASGVIPSASRGSTAAPRANRLKITAA